MWLKSFRSGPKKERRRTLPVINKVVAKEMRKLSHTSLFPCSCSSGNGIAISYRKHPIIERDENIETTRALVPTSETL
jgi:hypothetical protein